MPRTLLLVLSLLVAVGCASTPRVDVQSMSPAPVPQFETFALASNLEPADLHADPLLRRAIREEIVAALVERGMREAPRDEAALIVRSTLTRVGGEREATRTTYGAPAVYRQTTSLRATTGRVVVPRRTTVVTPRGATVTEPRRTTARSTLAIGIYDAETAAPLWRGRSVLRNAGSAVREQRLRDSARAILDRIADAR